MMSNPSKINRGAEIVDCAVPHSIYRYRPFANDMQSGQPLSTAFSREMDALQGNYVYCPSFNRMNDAMEGGFGISRKASSEQENIVRRLQQAKASLLIASFSESKDNLTMWGNYAGGFSGICICYNFLELRKQLTSDFSFCRVSYQEVAPRFESAWNLEEKAKRALSIKPLQWMAEREWRLFSKNSERAAYRNTKCIRAIYAGNRIARQSLEALSVFCDLFGIKLYVMEINMYEVRFTLNKNASDANLISY